MQDAIVRVILGLVVAGILMAILVPRVGNLPSWAAWLVAIATVAGALLVRRTKKRA